MSHSAVMEEGAACRPNISPAGRRRRQRLGTAAGVVTAAAFGGSFALGAAWQRAALVFLPAAFAAINLFQVRRGTCVARAREGTFEHDDFSTTKVSDREAAASRAVASGIVRDALLAAAGVSAVAAATALLR